jgi:Family of unknown function (DUF5995)
MSAGGKETSVTAITDATRWPTTMAGVAERVRGLDPSRPLNAVVADLGAIERDRRRTRDGIAAFNFMYRRVTEQVNARLAEFLHPAFVERLAVVFAEFYLHAYRAGDAHQWVSRAWAPLFERRRDKGISRLQFALAGMNAHINNDLAWALLQTWDEFGLAPAEDSAEHRDFDEVNDILAAVQAEVRAQLQSPLLRWIDRLLGRADDRFASISIARARWEAWERGTRWRAHLTPEMGAARDREVGYQSHLILDL